MNRECKNCYFGTNCCCSDAVCEDYTSLLEEQLLLEEVELERTKYYHSWFTYIDEEFI